MFNLFKKSGKYSDKELFSDLSKDGIVLTKEDIQKAKNNDEETLQKISNAYYDSGKSAIKGFMWLHKSASQNHTQAQFCVGDTYQKGGRGVVKNYTLAMEWFQKASFNGNVEARFRIAVFYANGWGVPQSWRQAQNWYQNAASYGNMAAQYCLAQTYQYGLCGVPNYIEAIKWYMQVIDSGQPLAMTDIGDLYENGHGLTKNIDTAIEWYKKAIDHGVMYGQYKLGALYETQEEVKDLQKAIYWYQEAANNNVEEGNRAAERLNRERYYVDEKHKEEEIQILDREPHNKIASTNDEQNQPASSSKVNYDQITNSVEDKIKKLEEALHLKMKTMDDENKKDKAALKALQKEQTQKNEENRQLREKVANLEAQLEGNNNDLNYDSSDNDNDINYDSEPSGHEEKRQ